VGSIPTGSIRSFNRSDLTKYRKIHDSLRLDQRVFSFVNDFNLVE